MASRTDLTYQQIVRTGLEPDYDALVEQVTEVQTLTIGGTPTGGTFELEFDGETTDPITWSATNSTLLGNIDTALEALTNIGAGNVVSEAGTLTDGIGTITITFDGDLENDDVELITVADNSLTGTAPTLAVEETTKGISGNHAFSNDGRMFLHVKNGSASSVTVTFETPGLVDGFLAIQDASVIVPAGEERMAGPFPPGIYNQSDGKVYVNYSVYDTDIDAALFRL